FVKSFPSSAREFEIETELTVHALQMRMAVAELDTRYKERPPGSTSKLRTFRDGWRILLAIVNLMRNERPLLFFALGATVPLGRGIGLEEPWLILIGFVCAATGLILDLVSHVRREVKRLAYLQHPAPSE